MNRLWVFTEFLARTSRYSFHLPMVSVRYGRSNSKTRTTAQQCHDAGKYKRARRRLRKLIQSYPCSSAALEVGIILGTHQDLAERQR
jgi:hypothetical protein